MQERQQHEIVLYQTDDANICICVIYESETFWLTQKAMAELFECSSDNISLHLRNIFKEESHENSTAEFFRYFKRKVIVMFSVM